ncbi:MAG: hypothetical protein ABSC25_23980 [Roseiarcus sp.]|jgi:hypothetical protein
MTAAPDRLTPAAADDLAGALAFALRFDGRKRRHDAAEVMAAIVAKRLVERLASAGFVIMKRPPAVARRRLVAVSRVARARRSSP